MYQESHNSKIFGPLIIALAIIFYGCNASATKSSNSKPVESQKNVEQERSPESQEITDPTCCGFSTSNAHKGIDEAWRLFTQDGRYRLALEKDMKFSEPAKNNILS
jgi:hypothetical protein